MSRQELSELAEWIVATCLRFGASIHTAYTVAGLIIKDFES